MSTDIYEFGHGYPENKRVTILNDCICKANEFQQLEYRGKLRRLPVVEVPIELPVYRIENIRTKNLQKEWLATHLDLDPNLFSSDPYSLETQENQYLILETLIKKENLLQNFESGELKQTENIIVSDDGIVVNGNRRLAAWRKLYYSNPEKYKHFQMISVAVLPDHDPASMYELEVRLQIAPELKAQYTWHAIAADLKEKLDNNYDIASIEKKQKIKKEEINTKIACYEYAQEYLETIGHPNEWSLLDQKEHAFQKIIKGRKSIKNPGEKDLFCKLSNSIISVKAEGGRLYEIIPSIEKNIDKIANSLVEKFNIDLDNKVTDENLFSTQADLNQEDIKKAIIRNEINDKDDNEIVSVVREVIKNNEDIEKEKKNMSFIFDQVKKASSCLNNAIENMKDTMSKEGIDKQLDNIETYVSILRDWIKK